ncbi:uncharacterized protein LOC106720630 isoform X1 [Papilio machaon]|uniref:uncharacterized protein LOC106720630 isoform X1 n=2 Tax=Papilio machaon TaxID=76193 RepID=UPI001E66353C|nr:uncharacterized protein LOC106720630 isoform X1 [Papilio machaon]
MKFHYKMESVLIGITALFCTILFLKLLHNLRSAFPWRVNCWFCNINTWVKFPARNSWFCPKCEQYNGFTKDGDYNRVLNLPVEEACKTPNMFKKSPPKNGLCKMCNINQQLKVTQLANFVPMNEKNFDDEIESYKLQLEKAYKLCSPCKRVLQHKLNKEKETFLGSKLLETRTPEKKLEKKQQNNNQILSNLINGSSELLAVILFVLVAIDVIDNIKKHKSLLTTMHYIKNIIFTLFERVFNIIKMKAFMTFPILENSLYDMDQVESIDMLQYFKIESIYYFNDLTQKILSCFVCFIQIVGVILKTSKANYSMMIDLLWLVFTITSISHKSIKLDPIYKSCFNLLIISGLILLYRKMKSTNNKTSLKLKMSPQKVKKPTMGTLNCFLNDDSMSLDTDDDVSLSKFGLNNLADSSNESITLNNSVNNGRSFSPRTESVWSKTKLNSTFCVNPVLNKSMSSVTDNVFIKPSFNKYHNPVKSDSDVELDESISSLSIGPKNGNTKSNPVFGLRKLNATPFVAPTPIARSRPLISPSKLGYSTSWVAGGYWGNEGQIFNINGSRSSSQSSGFESQTSSMNQRNLFSQPPSREESICGELDRQPIHLDRLQNCNTNYFQNSSSFTPICGPVFPQMQYNSHVQIPQPRMSQQTMSQNVFARRAGCPTNDMFKVPGGSGLIRLPQENSFASR